MAVTRAGRFVLEEHGRARTPPSCHCSLKEAICEAGVNVYVLLVLYAGHLPYDISTFRNCAGKNLRSFTALAAEDTCGSIMPPSVPAFHKDAPVAIGHGSYDASSDKAIADCHQALYYSALAIKGEAELRSS